ncbi:GGDEF domain-containing protein [Anaerorhabdus sp.]|uniref:GGDEF domain-containing protein n=1 Tax=Anaerorhabdus sp. TaxID=1872524 RepID=UPI002FC702C9
MTNRYINQKLTDYYLRLDGCIYNDFEGMKDNAEELLRQGYLLNDSYAQAYAFLHLASYYIAYRKFGSAEFNLNKSIRLCMTNDYDELLIQCYRNEGKLYQLKGDNFIATQVYDKIMKIAESKNDSKTIGILYNNIAYILMQLKDYEFAKNYFEKAIEKLQMTEHQNYNVTQIYLNLVRVCCDMNDLESAYAYLEKSKELSVNSNYVEFIRIVSEIRLCAIHHEVSQIKKLIDKINSIMVNFKGNHSIFAAELIYVIESLLIANMKEECYSVLEHVKQQLNDDDIEIELEYQKLLFKYQEKYEEINVDVSARYYYLLMTREKQELSSIAEGLRNKIKLFEINQKHSLLVKENENLEKQAHLDELTGLYNRRYCDKLLSKIGSNSIEELFGCIMLDIDHFKQYNDTYGHVQGDNILKHVADVLKQNSVPGINVGRYGGDEFYCLCTGLTDHEISNYLSNVLNNLRELKFEHKKNISGIVSITAGFYNEIKSKMSIEEIMKCADEALYVAKERGRDNYLNLRDHKH